MARGASFSMTIDDERYQKMLAEGLNPKEVLRVIGQKLAKAVRERVVSRMRAGDPLKMRSGALARAWERARESVSVSGHTVVASNQPDSPYWKVHEAGAVIQAKTAPYLTFKLQDGSWRRVKEVRIPARRYITLARDQVRAEEGPRIAKEVYVSALLAALMRPQAEAAA